MTDVAGMQAVAARLTSVDAVEPVSQSVSYGGSMTSDLAGFGDSLQAADARFASTRTSAVTEAVMQPLSAIDREAAALGSTARSAMESGETMTPAEIVGLTMRSQEFMFHSQLVSNVANRSSDGLQQLFRQQG